MGSSFPECSRCLPRASSRNTHPTPSDKAIGNSQCRSLAGRVTSCIFNGPAMISTVRPSQWVWGEEIGFIICVPAQTFIAIFYWSSCCQDTVASSWHVIAESHFPYGCRFLLRVLDSPNTLPHCYPLPKIKVSSREILSNNYQWKEIFLSLYNMHLEIVG